MENRYQIISKLATGGGGSVYQAYDTTMERYVALKRLPANEEQSHQAHQRENLNRETSTLSQLQHPNIVTVLDIGEDSEGLFVIMELLDGITFHNSASPTLPALEFHTLASQCLEALDAAEQVHIIHRDLKPANIMAVRLPSGRDQVKILDFGLAKFNTKPEPQTLDQNHSIMGSIHFIAPEQFQAAPVDHRADLYSLGCVFYFLLTRRYPFNGTSPRDIMNAHLNHNVRPIEQHRPDLPTTLSHWIMWFINRAPENRPLSAKDALSRLPTQQSLAITATVAVQHRPFRGNPQSHDTSPYPTAVAPTVDTRPSFPKWLPFLWIGAAIILAVGLYFTFRQHTTPPPPL